MPSGGKSASCDARGQMRMPKKPIDNGFVQLLITQDEPSGRGVAEGESPAASGDGTAHPDSIGEARVQLPSDRTNHDESRHEIGDERHPSAVKSATLMGASEGETRPAMIPTLVHHKRPKVVQVVTGQQATLKLRKKGKEQQKNADGLLLIRASGVTRSLCDQLTHQYHSYVKGTERGARAVDYLIRLGERNIGTIMYAYAGVRLPWPVMQKYSMSKPTSKHPGTIERSKRIAVCARYTLADDVPDNMASRALAVSLKMLKHDWYDKYGIDLLGVITFTKPPWKGTCFSAANFETIGWTSGTLDFYATGHKTEALFIHESLKIQAFTYKYHIDTTSKAELKATHL